MTAPQTTKSFVSALQALADPASVPDVARFFREDAAAHTSGNKILGVKIGKVFPVAKEFSEMPLDAVEALLDNAHYEVRLGAVSIMDFQARARRISDAQRESLYELYMRRHDRINNWDMVDRAAPYVVGGYLSDKSRSKLFELARSPNPCERRTAIVSTYYFIRMDDVETTFEIAEVLIHDDHDLVQKAVGSWIREGGKRDEPRLRTLLDAQAPTMPRTMLRYAVEKLPATIRDAYLKMSPAEFPTGSVRSRRA